MGKKIPTSCQVLRAKRVSRDLRVSSYSFPLTQDSVAHEHISRRRALQDQLEKITGKTVDPRKWPSLNSIVLLPEVEAVLDKTKVFSGQGVSGANFRSLPV